MGDRKKRNTIILTLCCLLVFMGIGYAFTSQVLTIDGTAAVSGNWQIKVTSVDVVEVVGTAENDSKSPYFTDDEVKFLVGLRQPGDRIRYKVRVENLGNINAKVFVNSTKNEHKDIIFTHDFTDGEILYASKNDNYSSKPSTREFYVDIYFDSEATTITRNEFAEYEIQLVYQQYDTE